MQSPGPHNRFCYVPVGIIHSPWKMTAGMPIQPTGAKDIRGTVEMFEDYAEGLRDIDGFSRVILIYPFHMASSTYQLITTPFLDPTPRGVFATRAPKRPNAIGLSCVRLIGREGRVLTVGDVDILDGTPLLDIKPYVPAFDSYPDASCGWLEEVCGNAASVRADDRFGT